MNKQFVTYEIALKLKELGFNELCFGYFNLHKTNTVIYGPDAHGCIQDHNIETIDDDLICSAPLWQQVIDRFRKNHDILISERYNGWTINKSFSFYGLFKTKELAILKALELINKE